MRYHNITKCDMNNGEGIRVVLWVSGCVHHCNGCHNPQTWNETSGIPFDKEAEEELFNELSQDHISGITFSGGDPLHKANIDEVLDLMFEIKKRYPDKNIWLYTGYLFDNLDIVLGKRLYILLKLVDVIVDGKYLKELHSPDKPWVGSSNQRVLRAIHNFKGE